MSVSKPEVINKLQKNFPNILKKDLNKLFNIFISEVIKALSNGERVELRDVMMFEPRIQKKKSIFKSENSWKNRSTWKKEYFI